jgi:hypothetical protein
MAAVLTAGRSAEEHKQMQALVRARPAYADVGNKLSSEGLDLGTLLE